MRRVIAPGAIIFLTLLLAVGNAQAYVVIEPFEDAQGGWIAVSGTGRASASALAISGIGDSATGAVAIAGTGMSDGSFAAASMQDSRAGTLATSVQGDSVSEWIAISAFGDAHSCPSGPIWCNGLSVSGSGNAKADRGWAFSLFGTCNETVCADVQTEKDAEAHWLAVSGTRNANATGFGCQYRVIGWPLHSIGQHCLGGTAISPSGKASGEYIGASLTGNSRGWFMLALSGSGDASGRNLIVSGTGTATGTNHLEEPCRGGIAVSIMGNSCASMVAVSGTEDARATRFAVSGMGDAEAKEASVSGCDLLRTLELEERCRGRLPHEVLP